MASEGDVSPAPQEPDTAADAPQATLQAGAQSEASPAEEPVAPDVPSKDNERKIQEQQSAWLEREAEYKERLLQQERHMEELYAKYRKSESLVEEMGNWKKSAEVLSAENKRLRKDVDNLMEDKTVLIVDIQRFKTLLLWLSIQKYVQEFKLRRTMMNLHRSITGSMQQLMAEESNSSNQRRLPAHVMRSDILSSGGPRMQSEIGLWTEKARRIQNSRATIKEITRHLDDIKDVLYTSVAEVQSQKKTFKKLSDHLFEHNNQLKRDVMAAVACVQEKDSELQEKESLIVTLQDQVDKLQDELSDSQQTLQQSRRQQSTLHQESLALKHKLMEKQNALDLLDIRVQTYQHDAMTSPMFPDATSPSNTAAPHRQHRQSTLSLTARRHKVARGEGQSSAQATRPRPSSSRVARSRAASERAPQRETNPKPRLATAQGLSPYLWKPSFEGLGEPLDTPQRPKTPPYISSRLAARPVQLLGLTTHQPSRAARGHGGTYRRKQEGSPGPSQSQPHSARQHRNRSKQRTSRAARLMEPVGPTLSHVSIEQAIVDLRQQ